MREESFRSTMSDINVGNDLERKIARIEKELQDARLETAKNINHFQKERRLLEGLVRLKEEDIRDHERLLKASQDRADRLLTELRASRTELLKRHGQRLADQVTIANLRARNAELTSKLRALYSGTDGAGKIPGTPATAAQAFTSESSV